MAASKKAAPSASRSKAGAKPGNTERKTKVEAKTKPTAKAGAAKPKKPAPAKLTDKQRELLVRVAAAGESGYAAADKSEARMLAGLASRKLLRVGKHKETGKACYCVSKSGVKHLPAPAPAPAPVSGPAPAEAAPAS